MFNVFPVTICYTRTPFAGPLKGVPLRCTFGVENAMIGAMKYNEMIRQDPMDSFDGFEVILKK
jgi:hypothetical protein